jgi:hypothetical protein
VLVLVPDADGEADWSRGMRLVDALAARWGYVLGGGQAVRWLGALGCLAAVARGGPRPGCPLEPCGRRRHHMWYPKS